MRTTVSLLRQRGAYERVHCLVVMEDSATVRELIAANWPEAEVTVLDSTGACAEAVENGTADAALLMSYTAQNWHVTTSRTVCGWTSCPALWCTYAMA